MRIVSLPKAQNVSRFVDRPRVDGGDLFRLLVIIVHFLFSHQLNHGLQRLRLLNKMRAVFLDATHDQWLLPMHVFRGVSVATAAQLRTHVRNLQTLLVGRAVGALRVLGIETGLVLIPGGNARARENVLKRGNVVIQNIAQQFQQTRRI